MTLLAADTAGLLQATISSQAHVVGISLGVMAMVAQPLVLDAPEMVRSLCILNSAPVGVGTNVPAALGDYSAHASYSSAGHAHDGGFCGRQGFLRAGERSSSP